jgi:hypothetical protein
LGVESFVDFVFIELGVLCFFLKVLNFIEIYAIMKMVITILFVFGSRVDAFCTMELICLGFV